MTSTPQIKAEPIIDILARDPAPVAAAQVAVAPAPDTVTNARVEAFKQSKQQRVKIVEPTKDDAPLALEKEKKDTKDKDTKKAVKRAAPVSTKPKKQDDNSESDSEPAEPKAKKAKKEKLAAAPKKKKTSKSDADATDSSAADENAAGSQFPSVDVNGRSTPLIVCCKTCSGMNLFGMIDVKENSDLCAVLNGYGTTRAQLTVYDCFVCRLAMQTKINNNGASPSPVKEKTKRKSKKPEEKFPTEKALKRYEDRIALLPDSVWETLVNNAYLQDYKLPQHIKDGNRHHGTVLQAVAKTKGFAVAGVSDCSKSALEKNALPKDSKVLYIGRVIKLPTSPDFTKIVNPFQLTSLDRDENFKPKAPKAAASAAAVSKSDTTTNSAGAAADKSETGTIAPAKEKKTKAKPGPKPKVQEKAKAKAKKEESEGEEEVEESEMQYDE